MKTSLSLPMVAVVGRPNVGKSSLVNRFLGQRAAIVQETPGVTRDRRSFEVEWSGRRFEIVDTGGLEPGARGLDARVAEQAMVAMEAADLILLVVDASTGITQDDLDVAVTLRRSRAPVIVVVNKMDSADPTATAEFHALGLGDPLATSALHGTGSGDLLDAIVAQLPRAPVSVSGSWASAALIGKPNVGKSSLLNRLIGEERAIVDPQPGTTRDPIDSFIDVNGRTLRLIDTAGMRRRVQIQDPIEYFSSLRSRGTLTRADVAALVVAADEGVTAHDQRLASEIVETGKACVIVLNKWDLVRSEGADRARFDRDLEIALRFLPWARLVRTSALTGRGIEKIAPALVAAVEAHRHRLPTATVNRIVRDVQAERPHPRRSGRAVRILYAVQTRVSPPRFLLFSNGRIERGYLRYLERRIRAVHPLEGTPLRFEVRLKAKREHEG